MAGALGVIITAKEGWAGKVLKFMAGILNSIILQLN